MDKKDVTYALDDAKRAVKKMVAGDPGLFEVRFDADDKPETMKERAEHCLWMISEANIFLSQGRIEKAMRWLGFVQGVLWATKTSTIEELKEMNRTASERETKHLREQFMKFISALSDDEVRKLHRNIFGPGHDNGGR